ncbi:hypothetical protein [Chromobacterium sphagni]|uniref:hypothetical protein n=1 Tax=Chromobacterium sphagni TaxID=1903179 RepID=UPI0019D34236|nr:hypothetical protein [Chromobacterium sphagni]
MSRAAKENWPAAESKLPPLPMEKHSNPRLAALAAVGGKGAMRILLSEPEQATLLECSLEAYRLYVAGLRPCMDMQTGIVGRGYPVSRAVLAINCQYVPPRGSKRPAWRPSHKQVDALIEELIRVGLVKRAAAVQEVQKLVVKLPLALVRAQEERDMKGKGREGELKELKTLVWKHIPDHLQRLEQDGSRQDEQDISGSQGNEYTYHAREGAAAGPTSPAVTLAIAARRLGVKVGGAAHPAVQAWADAGVTVPTLEEGIARCRAYISADEQIPVKYLASVLKSMDGDGKPSAGHAIRRGLRVVKGGQAGRSAPGWLSLPSAEAHEGAAVIGNVKGAADGWIE